MITVIVVISSIAIMQHINTSQYAITPGQATPIAPLMKIEGISTEKHLDKIELVDVYLQQLSVWQWIGAQFQSHVAFLPASALVTPGQPTSELAPQGYLEMNDSKQSASVAAFRALGYKVPGTPTGALITGINYPSPAWNANLNIADRIVEVNSTKVTSSCGLISAMHNYAPGQNVVLTIEKSHFSTTGEITWASAKPVTMKLKKSPNYVGPSGCQGVDGANKGWLGISVEDATSYSLPAKVSINTKYIGGPSAGLSMTLMLIDALSSGSLTNHQVIAATGTINADGDVGDVGGVAQKTVAVYNSGARVFLVPMGEVATAQKVHEPGLRIIGVSTLDQALAALRKLGGAPPIPLAQAK